jgi:dihydrolipoamide dehydrogenase
LLESSHQFASLENRLKQRGIQVSGVSLDLSKMMAHKDRVVRALTGGVKSLFKKNGIDLYVGRGRLDGPGRVVVADGETTLSAPSIIVATGSEPASLPGISIDHQLILDSSDAIALSEVPEHLVVVGAGYIGVELGTVWKRLGAKVTIIESLDRILPGTDRGTADLAQKLFTRQGLSFVLGARVTQVSTDQQGCVVHIEGQEALAGDRVLMAVGRKPHTAGLGLESLGISQTSQGLIRVNERYQTDAAGVYAVGDVIGGAMLAHKAEAEAVACVEMIVQGTAVADRPLIPSVAYTDPEIACVGASEDDLKTRNVPYRVGVFPWIANGRARAHGTLDGEAKILAHLETDQILGVHLVGPQAGELIAEAVVAMQMGATSQMLANACHPHPTLSEVLKEAALAVHGQALHI